jgi:hypothetical protein
MKVIWKKRKKKERKKKKKRRLKVWEILNFEYFFGHLKIQLKFEF